MKIRLSLISVCALLVGAAALPEEGAREVRVVGIQAKLFYQSTGTFSRDVLAEPRFAFWNTIIGEGDAEAPSNATLVLVEVSGSAGSYGDGASVRLRAIADGRTLVNRATKLSGFGSRNRQHVAFWVYDTGCDKIDLTATIVGQADTVRATIPFECGE